MILLFVLFVIVAVVASAIIDATVIFTPTTFGIGPYWSVIIMQATKGGWKGPSSELSSALKDP